MPGDGESFPGAAVVGTPDAGSDALDEFALALFLTGTEQTFPVYLVGQLRYASRLPVMIAFAVLMMMITLFLVLMAEWIRRRGPPSKVR